MKTHHIHQNEKYLLTIWFIINLCVGFAIVQDFGISWDEPKYYLYAQNTVDAYKSIFGLLYTPVYGPSNLPQYGPGFIIIAELVIRLLKLIFPSIFAANVWHFSYFFIFQLGGLCLYLLARRWFNTWAGWGVLLIYTFQPVLWGHAFVNPKDVPFMVFCLFTIWSGFNLADSLDAQNVAVSLSKISETFWSWVDGGKRQRINKLGHQTHPPRWNDYFSILLYPKLILAGILLGLTISIRILGPLPGIIVIIYLAFALRIRSIPIILAYLLYGSITTFLTWPYLWSDPIKHFFGSVALMSNFNWPGHILFDGVYYTVGSLPISYLPVLLNIQLTETFLLLIYIGLGILIWKLVYEQLQLDLLLVVLLGALIPIVGLVVSRAKIYDNFRQILFTIPPLIILAGLAMDKIFSAIKHPALRLIFLLVLMAPGVYGIARLHPYEYVYYNNFAGGVRGAYGNYELDYWATSYREAALFLNETAPSDSRVAVYGPVEIVSPYTRPDIKLNIGSVAKKLSESQNMVFNYAISLNGRNTADEACKNVQTIKTVERDGVVLMSVKEIPPGEKDCP